MLSSTPLFYERKRMPDNVEFLISNLDKIHSTEMGLQRLERNLGLNGENAVIWCKKKIADTDSNIYCKGKNWYIDCNDCIITVNRTSFTIITAHKKKQMQ
jgi:hypothetical protein